MTAGGVAIVTGASRGLGLALGRALAERGWRLVVDARGGAALDEAWAGVPNVIAIAGSLADVRHRRALVAAAGPRIDVLVNNASVLGPSPQPVLARLPARRARGALRDQRLAPLASSSTRFRGSRPGARVVNVTSDAAVEPYEGWGGYGSSKAALEQLTACSASSSPTCASTRSIRATCAPQMHQEAFPGEDISDRPLPEESVPGSAAAGRGRPRRAAATGRGMLAGVARA